jgi:hypothetical protein
VPDEPHSFGPVLAHAKSSFAVKASAAAIGSMFRLHGSARFSLEIILARIGFSGIGVTHEGYR